MKLLEEAAAMPGGTVGWYGHAPPVLGRVEALGGCHRLGSGPRCVDNCLEGFNGLQLSYLCPKMTSPIDYLISSFNSEILVKQT